jgi:hypothetical protein
MTMTRVMVVTALSATLVACSTHASLSPDGGGGTGGASGGAGAGPGQVVVDYPQTINRNVDVLFMIDNSSSGTVYEAKLNESFSTYVNALQALPGGLPNLHLAVVSSSLGAGRSTDIDRCPAGGDQGAFQTKPLGTTCASASLNPGQTFIVNASGTANYTGALADVFSCISALGDGGCGFEHQLASIARALGADGAPPPAQNANFLRPDAYLQIVVLSDEDDCSAPPDSDLFDTSSQLVSDPLGPLQSYRCNEFGHLCGGKMPPRSPAGPTDLGTCVSNENGRLLRVGDLVAQLKHLKTDPAKVYVAAISAPPTPYVVNVGPPEIKTDPSMWPYVQHSCMSADGTYGDPAVRTKQWVDGFGANGLFETICADTFTPALQAIAGQIAHVIGPPCLDATIDPATCTFVDHTIDATSGAVSSVPLPRCASGATQPACWDVVSDARCPSNEYLKFMRTGTGIVESSTATCTKKGSP